MRVVQVNAVYHFSSTGRNVEEMHNYLIQKGVESYVFCANESNPKEGIFKMGGFVDHKIHALFSRLLGLRGYFSTLPTIKTIRHLKRIQPDVVVLGNLHSNQINVPMILKYLAEKNIATIWVLHDCWAYTGGCTHYTIRNCFKWKDTCDCCPYKGNDGSWLFNTSGKVFDDRKKYFGAIEKLSFVGVSDWVTNDAKQSMLRECTSDFRRIYNWVNLDVFYPRNPVSVRESLGVMPGEIMILGVSQRWSRNKGDYLFFEIANRIPEAKVVMIGYQELYPDNIIHVNAIDSTDLMAQYYSAADVFINFSQQETFGKVAAEALACGTPVIANDNTANPEIVGDCGRVITNNDIDECCEAIARIIKDGKSSYSEKCVQRARSLFNKEIGLNAYYNLFKELASACDES